MVISLAPQAVASLAARFGVPLAGAYAAVSEFSRTHLGATHVIDLSMAARLEALHAGREFVERYRAVHLNAANGAPAPDGPKRELPPILEYFFLIFFVDVLIFLSFLSVFFFFLINSRSMQFLSCVRPAPGGCAMLKSATVSTFFRICRLCDLRSKFSVRFSSGPVRSQTLPTLLPCTTPRS